MDLLEERAGIEASTKIINLIREKKFDGCVSALTVPILWFLAEKNLSGREAKKLVNEAIKGFSIASLDSRILNEAFKSEISDFEDAIQLYSAINSKCGLLITRNKKDFGPNNKLDILTPEEFLTKYKL